MAGQRLTSTEAHSKLPNTGKTFERFFELSTELLEESRKSSSLADRFNRKQCEYLVEKLEIAMHSAVACMSLSYRKRTSVSLANWMLLVRSALDVKIFIDNCRKRKCWIRAASMWMDSFEHVASLSSRLELCTWSNRNRYMKGIMLGTDLRRALTKFSDAQDCRFGQRDLVVSNSSDFQILNAALPNNPSSAELDAEVGVRDLVIILRKKVGVALSPESDSDRVKRLRATSQVLKLVAALVDYPFPYKKDFHASRGVHAHVRYMLSEVEAAFSETNSDVQERQLAVSLLRGLEGASVLNSIFNIKSVLTKAGVTAFTMANATMRRSGAAWRESILGGHDRSLAHSLLKPLLEKLTGASVQGARTSRLDLAYSNSLRVQYFEKPDSAKLGIHFQLNIMLNTVREAVNSLIESIVEWDELVQTASLGGQDKELAMCLLVGLETVLADIPIPDKLDLANSHVYVPNRRGKSANLGFRDEVNILLDKLEAALGPGYGSISNTKERQLATSLRKQLRAVLIGHPSVGDQVSILLSKVKTASKSGSTSESDERELASTVLGGLEAALADDPIPDKPDLHTSVRDEAKILLNRVGATLSSGQFTKDIERQFAISLLSGLETALANNPVLDKPDLAQLSDRDQVMFGAVLSSERISNKEQDKEKLDGMGPENDRVEKEYRLATSILGGLEAALINNLIPEKPALATLSFGDQVDLLEEVEVASSSNRISESSDGHQLATSLVGRLRTAMAKPNSGKLHVALMKAECESLVRQEHLGRGSFGDVFASEWLGTRVAEKVLPSNEAEGSDDVTPEISILAALSHPSIVQLLCYVKQERNLSIVLELMDKDLSKLIHDRMRLDKESESPLGSPFPVDEAVDLMLQIAEGMEYLHRKKVLHRDLKPENILLKFKKCEDIGAEFIYAKVADFGLSKTRERTTTKRHPTYNTGTSRWMAPELIKAKSGSHKGEPSAGDAHQEWKPFKSDVYSFGMVCYGILTGDEPFMDVEFPRIIKQNVLQGKRPSIPSRCPLLLRSMVQKCWRQDPKERPSFTEICAELRFMKGALLIGREL